MITNTILDDETLLLVSQTFKALSDPTRKDITFIMYWSTFCRLYS